MPASSLLLDDATRRQIALLDGLRNAVIATDVNGIIVDWSESAAALYGWSAPEVIGRNVLDVTPSTLSRAQGEEIMTSLKAGRVWSGQFPVRTREGNEFLASVTDVPLLDDARRLAGIIGVSAPSLPSVHLLVMLQRFATVFDRIWSGQVSLLYDFDERAVVPASEPHVTQLLALLMLRESAILDRGGFAEIEVTAAEEGLLTDFSGARLAGAVHIRLRCSDDRPRESTLHRAFHNARPTSYAAALVAMIGGVLLAEAGPQGGSVLHLMLPVR